MPMVLDKLPAGHVFGFAWFVLLFLAGITSSISLAQPALAFLEDEFGLTKREACTFFVLVTFLMCQAVIFGFGGGVLDEFDFWGGTFCLVLFGTIETILFAWVFGMDKAWTELHVGADITIPTRLPLHHQVRHPLLPAGDPRLLGLPGRLGQDGDEGRSTGKGPLRPGDPSNPGGVVSDPGHDGQGRLAQAAHKEVSRYDTRRMDIPDRRLGDHHGRVRLLNGPHAPAEGLTAPGDPGPALYFPLSAIRTASMCPGPVPQQPPRKLAPAASSLGA